MTAKRTDRSGILRLPPTPGAPALRRWRRGWPVRYAASVAGYSWRWQRGRLGPWLLTVIVVAAVLSVAATAQLLVSAGQRGLDAQARSASEMQVFLSDSATPAQTDQLRRRLVDIAGVRSVTYRSKEEARNLARQSQQLAPLAAASAGNPFPAGFVVDMTGPDVSGRVAGKVATDPAVDSGTPTSVTAAQAQRLDVALRAVRVASFGLDGVAVAVAVLVALALLRGELRVRAGELRILALVGVPRPVMRLPLLAQSLSIALVAGALAIGALIWAARTVLPALDTALPFAGLGDNTGLVQLLAAGTMALSCAVLVPCGLLVRLPR